MGKYDLLKEPASDDLWGVRHQERVSRFLHRKFGTSIIHGYLPCPDCLDEDGLQFSGARVTCRNCATTYTLEEFVAVVKSWKEIKYAVKE